MGKSGAIKKKSVWNRVKKYWTLYVLSIIPLVYLLVFRYWPIVLQYVMATRNYTLRDGIFGSEFIGFDNFAKLFSDDKFWVLLYNTLYISVMKLIWGFFPPIILAILLYDMKSAAFRKFSQSILYIPHFFSWVVVHGIVVALFSSDGYINLILQFLGFDRVHFLMGTKYWMEILVGSSVWKNIGWGTIIYLAALANINTELFEAARIDGAGPIQRIRYITLPGILPIVSFQLILSLGNILGGANTEQILLFYDASNYKISDVIGTWTYRQGLGQLQYSLGSAVSVFESTVGMFLVLVSNKIANKVAGVGIW